MKPTAARPVPWAPPHAAIGRSRKPKAGSGKRFDYGDMLAAQLRAVNLPEPTREYRFDPVRRWRFDACWPDRLLAVELDGGEWIHGRHSRGLGMQKDNEKFNAAQLAGWTVLRFVGSQVKSGAALAVLEPVLR